MNDRKTIAWDSQSLVTDPGAARAAIDELPGDLRALREASSRLVFHYRGGGDWAENGVPPGRAGEINTRYADSMFGLLLERGQPTLARDRGAPDRVVGCCRDATVLFLALARHKGIPARARVGFAAYFHPGWLIDHVVAEVWDEGAGRWRLIEPEMGSDCTPEVNGRPVDWLDLAADQFVTGPRAWQAARSGAADPGRHVVDPGLDIPVLRGWPYLAHNVIHDLAALNKTEMLLWDGWGMQLDHGPGPVPEADAAVLDEICARTADPGVPPDIVAALAGREGLRVPATVTSFDPYGGPPREVVLRTPAGLPAGESGAPA
jgi:Transglutaminase-like superfamily